MTATFTCNLCDAMCGLHLDVEGGRISGVRGNPNDVFSRGHICPKGFALKELAADPDRLRSPMRRAGSGWQAIGWEEALAETAARLREVRRLHGRDAVGFYYGNPVAHSHRGALGMAALTLALGTRNRFDPNSQDSNPKIFAAMQMYGDGLSITVPDVDRCKLLVVLGANPLVSGGSIMALGDVRGRLAAIRGRGGRMVVLDPRRNETAKMAGEHHFVRPGSDAALLLSLLHVLFAEKLVDEPALRATTSGLDELRVLAERFPPARGAAASDLPEAVIRGLARDLARPGSVIYGRIGTCQNEFGPVCAWLLEAINVLTGNFDCEGGAMFPEAAADAGPIARLLIGNVYGRWKSRVRGLPEYLGSLPSAAMAEEMEAGHIRALVCMAGNPVLSTPNGPRLERAIGKLDCRISIDFYLNETSRLSDLVLPPLIALETGNFDLVLGGVGVRNFVKASHPALPRPDGALDDWQIASEILLRLRLPRALRPLARPLLRNLPDRIVDLLLRRRGLSLRKLLAAPDGIDLGPLMPCRKSKVRTRGGRVQLCPTVLAADVPRLERWVESARSSLVLIGRRDLRTNNSWMHNVPTLAKGPDRARLFMHPDDAAARGLREGDRVSVRSRTGALDAALHVTDEVMNGVVSLPHGFGHAGARETLRVAGGLPGGNVNALTDEERVEPILGTSALNGVPVEVTPAA